MRSFTLLWLGQLLSMPGSAMTRFVLAIWLWQQTGQATALVLVGVVSGAAAFVANLAAGPLVDRASRKAIIIVSDLLTGLTTVFLLIQSAAGELASWHIYLAAGLSGAFQTFQGLAFSTTITLLVPKAHYTRANSMLTVAEYAAGIGAPDEQGCVFTARRMVTMVADPIALLATGLLAACGLLCALASALAYTAGGGDPAAGSRYKSVAIIRKPPAF